MRQGMISLGCTSRFKIPIYHAIVRFEPAGAYHRRPVPLRLLERCPPKAKVTSSNLVGCAIFIR
ncbi:hypothetical protein MPLA_750013 [Mesorhizobium sp. ORS 3359]|nr:hypothetical protein MPLA_750013 [Mesorhizobium sp. ORS 3359]